LQIRHGVRPRESTALQGWDDKKSSITYSTVLTDDKGNSSGTLKRAMNFETRSAQRLQVGQIVLQVLLLVVFLGSTSQRHSRATAGVFGVLFAYVGVYGGMGLIAVAGMKWNIIEFFVLPFVLVSICIGDMLILAIALDKRCREYDSKAPRVDAVPKWMEHHAGPLTSKWLIILVFFAVMAASPFPVISNTACAAVAAVVALWLLMLTAFPAVLVLDLKRQQADRAELCCLFLKFSGKAPLSYELSVAPHLEHLAAQFCPNIGNRALQSAVVSGFVALVVVSAIKLGALPLGFQFDKLPADGTFLQQYFRDRLEHFPVYDAALSFASGDVSDPRVQLTMLKYRQSLRYGSRACMRSSAQAMHHTHSIRTGHHASCACFLCRILNLHSSQSSALQVLGGFRRSAKFTHSKRFRVLVDCTICALCKPDTLSTILAPGQLRPRRNSRCRRGIQNMRHRLFLSTCVWIQASRRRRCVPQRFRLQHPLTCASALQ
jgi:hypothetical protein